jgi:hypothetical protein
MQLVLLIGGIWLALVVLVIGMFHVASGTPTPQPVTPRPLRLAHGRHTASNEADIGNEALPARASSPAA